LQAPYQIAADLLDHISLIAKKVGDGLQQRLKAQTLTHQFPIGKLTCRPAGLDTAQPLSLFFASARARFSALMYRGAVWCSRSCSARPLSRPRCTAGTSSSGTQTAKR